MPSININDILHNRPEVEPKIYAYIATNMPDHDGYIKIGYTEQENYKDRIKQQTHTAGVKTQVLLVESAVCEGGDFITDKDVHRLLEKKGFEQYKKGKDKNEWYKCDIDDVKNAIKELKTGQAVDSIRNWDFKMRMEQETAVKVTSAFFKKAHKDNPNRAPRFLWNAKMRFGKTFATYQLAKKMGYQRVLVLTFKPAVESAWKEDLERHIDFKGWQFVSNNEAKYDRERFDEAYEACDKNKPIVVFGSFQDLLGKNKETDGIKAKNEFVHTTNWDLIVFDEYHYGAWRDNAQKLFQKYDEEDESSFDPSDYAKEEAGNAINETDLPITTENYLFLSGTPFKALASGEFLEDEVFSWTYTDEQREKENWEGEGENPYAALPKMCMLTYRMPKSITHVAINEGFDEFDINEFFKAEPKIKDDDSSSRFVHEDYVQKWLELIQGKYMAVDDLKLGKDKPPMPFSDVTLKNVLSHTLWYLPNVKSCYAMYNLLTSKANQTTFGQYKIVKCFGKECGVGIKALIPLKAEMADPLKTKTITLSCGKLMTGVTVAPWTAIFMLLNMKSPETYFQAAFRVQSPWTITDEFGKKIILKKECYIFDFALERSLYQIANYQKKSSVNAVIEADPVKDVEELISFLPVLAYDDGGMKQINAQEILDITYAGTSATLLARRWQSALLVHVDNDTLKKLQANPDLLDALMNIEGFRNLNKDLKTIISKSEKIKKLKKEGKKPTAKEKKELTEEEKKMKSLRKQVQENLIRLATRIPAFMYLTDFREQVLKDVITQLEPDLFKKVTGLSVKDFEGLVSINLFDPDKMNQGIFGFRKYEDSSLEYTGINKHEGENVGGWDTVITKKEYDDLYSKQQGSLNDVSSAILSGLSEEEIEEISIINETENKILDKVAENPDEGDSEYWKKEIEKVKEGAKVTNPVYGNGKITSVNSKYFYVKFKEGKEKRFMIPGAILSGNIVIK